MWILKPCSHPENTTHNSHYLLETKKLPRLEPESLCRENGCF